MNLHEPGTPIDRKKLLSLGVISKRTKSQITEGREHPDSGQRFKATTDEAGNTVTEHGGVGVTGTSARQDVHLRPDVVRWGQGD